MKRENKKQLRLGREAIRQLGDLGGVAGGCDTTSSPTDAADSAGTCTITFSRPCC